MTPETLNDKPPDWFKEYMWLGFVQWALSEKGFRQGFEAATGIKEPTPAKTPLDAMIDEVTGYKLDYIKKFVVWLTENHWGEAEAPEIYFRKFKER